MSNFSRQLGRIHNDLANAYTGVARTMAKALTVPTATQEEALAPGEITGREFMAKALAAHAAGHISSVHLTTSELAIGAGQPPPPRIVKAVMTQSPYSDWD